MKNRNILIVAVLALAALAVTAVLTLPLLAGDKEQPKDEGARQGAPANSNEAGALTRVESVKVCMINDALFPNDQIPVEVDGKTYYGCCPMCKERLTTDAASRTAIDPLSGAEVDKATAVIAARADGSVLYFENEENLERYQEKTAGGEAGGGR